MLLFNPYYFTLSTLDINNRTASVVYVTVVMRLSNTAFLSTKLAANFTRLRDGKYKVSTSFITTFLFVSKFYKYSVFYASSLEFSALSCAVLLLAS